MTALRTPLEQSAVIFLFFFFALTLTGADCSQPDLFRSLRVSAASNPGLAFDCATALHSERQQEFVLRLAFAAAAPRDPDLVVKHWAQVAGKTWLAAAGFFPVLEIARRLPAPEARQLVLEATRRNPSLALREYDSYGDLPWAGAIFEQAVRSAPDEAVSLATRQPAVLARLRAHQFRVLVELASEFGISATERERLAAFHQRIQSGELSQTDARRLIHDYAFFPALVQARLNSADDADFLDRLLARTASLSFRWFEDRPPRLAHLNAIELYLLLSYGRAEEDDRLFTSVFDSLLLPKLRGIALPNLQLRHFVALAADHSRLDVFLRATPIGTLARSMADIHTLEDALDASEVIENITQPAQLMQAQSAIQSYRKAGEEESSVFYSLLAARIDEKLKAPAGEFARFFNDDSRLRTKALFDATGMCTQRHVFHADDDGVESFQSFQRQYALDPAWHWEDHGDWVRLSADHVVIYANKPVGEGQAAISRLLAATRTEPTVFVHRGHSYHVERSLRYLTSAAHLVFLGSCRGLGVTAEVLLTAPEAQLIVTRSVGTASVNDPLLKAINDELRKGVSSIDWQVFWKAQQTRFGRSPVFEDYIPPYRNPAARLAAAYYAWLAS